MRLLAKLSAVFPLEDEDDGDDDNDEGKASSHKSHKKQAERRREEKEISRREMAWADGTADENPETVGDFERLLAGNPNSSELWIRYMAFYLSLADIPSTRAVADKALGRIEFRQEREKLNVWTALLTLEHKYGNDGSLQATVD
jgi:rRNA biogenesis protein RRP5